MIARRAERFAFLAGIVAVVTLGCARVADLHIPVPPPGSPGAANAVTSTVVSDLTGNTLTVLPSTPPPTVAVAGGTSTLSGVVTGPNGVVGGATVQIQRLVGDSVGSKAVVAQADGTWNIPKILGGLYRIRAWLAPDLDLITPQLVLLGAGQPMSVTLTLMSYGGESATATVSPSPPQVGQLSRLTIQVLQETVGPDGVVRAAPLRASSVSVLAAGNVTLSGTNPATTGSTGQVTFSLGCSSIGPVGLSAVVDQGTSFNLTVPDCAVTATPTTGSQESTTTLSTP